MPPPTSLVNKLKVQLKLSIARLRMTQQKDTAIAKQTRRQMAQLVEEGKIESARIRVENIIRSDITTELNEILELYCELLLARSQLLDPPLASPLVKGQKEEVRVDPGLEEAVRSIIYAAQTTGVKELIQSRALLVEKFGKEFALSAMEGEGVAPRVLKKMKVESPPEQLVNGYLREICRTYGVKLKLPGDPDSDAEEEEEEEDDDDDDDQPGSGGKIAELEDALEAEELSKAKAPTDFGLGSPLRIAPPSPSTENVTPKIKLPEAAKRETKPKPRKASVDKGKKADGDGPGGKIPNFDDLTARFAALKR